MRVDRRAAWAMIWQVMRNPRKARRLIRDSPIRRMLDSRVDPWQEQIDSAYKQGKWGKTVSLIHDALRETGAIDSPALRSKLILSQARLGNWTSVDNQVRNALERFPEADAIYRLHAERLMMLRDYSGALASWNKAAQLGGGCSEKLRYPEPFPLAGQEFDWFERDWGTLVQNWALAREGNVTSPSEEFYLRLLGTLTQMGRAPTLQSAAELAMRDYPHSSVIHEAVLGSLVLNSHGIGREAFQTRVTKVFANRQLEKLERRLSNCGRLVKDIEGMGRTRIAELRLLTLFRGSDAEMAIRLQDFWDEQRISSEALKLAKLEKWPEQFSEVDLVSDEAWRRAQDFAKPRAKAVGVSAPALARATFHYFKQEVTLRTPVERLAASIASKAGESPVFVDLGSSKIAYMASYPASRMQTMYFYDALRRNGCNAVLVRFPRRATAEDGGDSTAGTPSLVKMPAIVLDSQPAQLQPPSRPIRPVKGNPAEVIVPAGIRSVKALSEVVGDAVILNSGSAVKRFAYDRSGSQNWNYDVNLSLHSKEPNLLPKFRIVTEHYKTWQRQHELLVGTDLLPAEDDSVEAFLSIGKWDFKSPESWLERAVVPYFHDFVRRTRDNLQKLSIMDAHIGDYLYAESELVAAKVKDRGGRVHLWPHSTNPVHVEFHDPNFIASVHAVTKSGCAMWRERIPRADITLQPDLMLPVPKCEVQYVEGAPLSVVVIGGRPIMRNLPILDVESHEQLYREFFGGLSRLQRRGKVKVYFKPRGKTGEHELWLDELLGPDAVWERVLTHPLKMNLTNPVFVSLSVGSSALLEGLTRGIPGLVVREGFAREYLAAEAEAFKVLSLRKGLSTIGNMTIPMVWERTRERQMAALLSEMGVTS